MDSKADRKAARGWADMMIVADHQDKNDMNLAAAFLEADAELEAERKAREDAERGQRELCVAIGTTTDEWAFSNQRSHIAEQRAADLQLLFHESQRRRLEHEDTIGKLTRRIATIFQKCINACNNLAAQKNDLADKCCNAIVALANEPAALMENSDSATPPVARRDTEPSLPPLAAAAPDLQRRLNIAELKNRGTLANNLCPDHRDKQVGKPCLACTIETLQRRLDGVEAATIERCGWAAHSCILNYGDTQGRAEQVQAAIRALSAQPNAAAGQEVKLNGGAPETEVPSSTLGGPAPSAAPIWEQLAAIGDSAPAGTWDKAPDAALPGLELAAGIVAEWKRDYVMPECCDGAQEIALSAIYKLIRAEIARRKQEQK